MIAQWASPDGDSQAGLEALRKAMSPAVLIVLSDSEDAQDVSAVFQAGANAYVPASTDGEILTEIFRLVLAGGTYVPWPLTGLAEASDIPPVRDAPGVAGLTHLTRRQRQIVQLLAEGLSNDEIGARLGLKSPTVKAHVSRTLKVLGTKSRLQAALWFKDQSDRSE